MLTFLAITLGGRLLGGIGRTCNIKVVSGADVLTIVLNLTLIGLTAFALYARVLPALWGSGIGFFSGGE